MANREPSRCAAVIARHCHAGPDVAQPHCRNRYSCASRPLAVEPVSHTGCRGARHHLDFRRPGSDARRRVVRRTESKPGAAIHQHRYRHCRQRLSRRRGARRAVFRLADRPARPQETVFHHAHRLPRRDCGHRLVVEFMDLRPVSFLHRRGHWRRICRDQFHHPGIGPRALSRMDRPLHQRQFLDWRRDRRGRLDRSARSDDHRSGIWLAARLPDRRRARADHLCDAVLDSGKPALADDAWPRRGSRSDRRRYRAAIRGRRADGSAAACAAAVAPRDRRSRKPCARCS